MTALRRSGRLVFLDRSPEKLIATADRPLGAQRNDDAQQHDRRGEHADAAHCQQYGADGSGLDGGEAAVAIPRRYIGLIVPNLVSLYKGDNVHENILDTALFGAIFVLFCDILARVFVYPYELSVGLTVGVIGSGMFLYLVLRRKSYAS